jgi:hypothetical protein
MRTLAVLLALVGYCFVAMRQRRHNRKIAANYVAAITTPALQLIRRCVQDQLRHLHEPLSDKIENKHMCRLMMYDGNSVLGSVLIRPTRFHDVDIPSAASRYAP